MIYVLDSEDLYVLQICLTKVFCMTTGINWLILKCVSAIDLMKINK